jgi:hypothetical protein
MYRNYFWQLVARSQKSDGGDRRYGAQIDSGEADGEGLQAVHEGVGTPAEFPRRYRER